MGNQRLAEKAKLFKDYYSVCPTCVPLLDLYNLCFLLF